MNAFLKAERALITDKAVALEDDWHESLPKPRQGAKAHLSGAIAHQGFSSQRMQADSVCKN